MAKFKEAFEKTIQNEGGYVLHEVEGDTGGMTYAGISRNNWPDWDGWPLVDMNDPGLNDPILHDWARNFYREHFWDRILGDDIQSQAVAESFFDFSVNTGVSRAVKIVQGLVCAVADGKVGPITIGLINDSDPYVLQLRYVLAKVQRYAGICNKNRSQSKFLLGWVNRSLKGV